MATSRQPTRNSKRKKNRKVPPAAIVISNFGEDACTTLRDIFHQPKHHLDEGHSLLLYAILRKSHYEIRRSHDHVDKVAAATQPYLLKFTGWSSCGFRGMPISVPN